MTSHEPHRPADASEVATAARALFERATGNTSAGDRNRLRLMRRNALARAEHPGALSGRWTLPMAMTASALLAGTLGWFSLAPAGTKQPAVVSSSELEEAVTAADDDAQLYAWLGEGPVALAGEEGESL